MKFSIRDLFLVTMIVALALCWLINYRQLVEAKAAASKWRILANELAETMNGSGGWTVRIDNDAITFSTEGPAMSVP